MSNGEMETNEHEALLLNSSSNGDGSNNTSLSSSASNIPRSIHINEAKSMDSFTEEVGVNRFHYILICIMGLANVGDATEVISMGYIIASQSFSQEFGEDIHQGKESLTAAIFFGMLIGGLTVGYAGECGMGRKPLLLLTLALNTFAGTAAAATPDLFFLTVLRCIAGIGVGGTVPCIFTIGAELTPPKQRGFFLALIGWFWMVGSVITSLLAILIMNGFSLSWRYFSLACVIPSTICFFLVWHFVPESPRYLILFKNYEKAASVLNYIAGWSNKMNLPFTISPGELLNYDNNTEREHNNNTAKIPSYVEQLKSLYQKSTYRRTTLVLQSLWFFLSFSNFGLITWISTLFTRVGLDNPFFDSFCFAAGALPGNILSTRLIENKGRRMVMIISMALGALALAIFAILVSSSNPIDSTVMIVLTGAAFNGCATASWNALNTMSAETFPTTVRTTVMGILSASGRIGAMFAQIVNASLVKNPTLLLALAAVIMFFGAIAPLILPDMKGRVLQDHLIGEGDEKNSDEEDNNNQSGVVVNNSFNF